MRKNLFKIGIVSMLLLCATATSLAQKGAVRKAEKDFNNLAYLDAIKIYENVAKKGYINTSLLQKLGDSYYFNGKLVEAHKWYNELFNNEYAGKNLESIPSEYYYRFSQTLKAIGEYDKADLAMEKFVKKEESDMRSKLYKEQRGNYLKDIENNSNRFELSNLTINSSYSDYGASLYGDKLIFTSARETNKQSKRKLHEWTNESFTSLFSSTISGDNSLGEPVKFAPELESKVNEASAVFTSDGKTMYFTRNNTTGKGKKNNSTLLKIYKAELSDKGKWVNVKELPFNSNDFNTAHPALTPDGKWLYFSSDREGSRWQSDIYRVAIHSSGDYGSVERLGNQINTEGRETFPFISKDNYLFFSSDGHPGLGGLDIFVSKINVDGSFGKVTNMGAPINSNTDDFGLYMDYATKKGFLTSNRAGGKGGDDIYFFNEKQCHQNVEGTIQDSETQEVLSNATVVIYDNMFKKVGETRTNKDGYYKVENLACGMKYRIKVEALGFNTEENTFEVSFNEKGNLKQNLNIERTEKVVEVKDDLFKKLKLEPIYFGFDKSGVRSDATVELMKIVEVMRLHPKLKIEVRSHTDSRGVSSYNMKLSERRAKTTVDWIINQGIDASRISGKGFGDKNLLNKCKKGVRCTVKEHQLNRRSEFIILDI